MGDSGVYQTRLGWAQHSPFGMGRTDIAAKPSALTRYSFETCVKATEPRRIETISPRDCPHFSFRRLATALTWASEAEESTTSSVLRACCWPRLASDATAAAARTPDRSTPFQ